MSKVLYKDSPESMEAYQMWLEEQALKRIPSSESIFWTQNRLARSIIEEKDLVWVDDHKTFYSFLDNGYWGVSKDGYSVIRDVVNDYADDLVRRGGSGDVRLAKRLLGSSFLNGLDSEFKKGAVVRSSDFDSNTSLIGFRDVVFDAESGEVLEKSPDLRLVNFIDLEFDLEASHPKLEKMISVLPDAETIEWVQTILGAALLGERVGQFATFFVGGAANGKSSFLNAVSETAGDYSVNLEMRFFSNRDEKQAAAAIEFKRQGIIPELMNDSNSAKQVVNSAFFKSVTGEESMVGRRLWENPREITNMITLFIASNRAPNLDALDSAVWRRVVPIDFKYTFRRDGQGILMENDPEMEKIAFDEEFAQAFLAWRLEGLSRYLENRDFYNSEESVPAASVVLRDEWRSAERLDIDSGVLRFVDSKLVAKEGTSVVLKEVYSYYSEWCGLEKLVPLSNRVFYHELSKHPLIPESVVGKRGLEDDVPPFGEVSNVVSSDKRFPWVGYS